MTIEYRQASSEDAERLIDQIRAKGATPILFTLTPRNDYEADNPKRIQRKLTDFTPAIFAIGKEMNVPVIDLNDISALKLEKYGPWKTNYHFYLDKIHSSAYGARMNAQSAAEGILASTDPQLAVFKTDTCKMLRCECRYSRILEFIRRCTYSISD